MQRAADEARRAGMEMETYSADVAQRWRDGLVRIYREGELSAQTLAYCRRMWQDWVNRFGSHDLRSFGFSFGNRLSYSYRHSNAVIRMVEDVSSQPVTKRQLRGAKKAKATAAAA